MKYIEMTKGYRTIVDDEDFDWLAQYRWRLHRHRDGGGYAVARVNGRNVLMHRLILNTPIGLEADHINRDKLDNRRSNLRNVTRTINQLNRKMLRNNTTGYRGLVWNKRDQGYYIQLRIVGKMKSFGFFKKIEDALPVLERAYGFQETQALRKGR